MQETNTVNQDLNLDLHAIILNALDDAKAQNITSLDVQHLTSITDRMVICTGTSSRHMRTIADRVGKAVKLQGFDILSQEGEGQTEWMIVDCGDVVLHVMTREARDFYNLEGLWDIQPAD